MSHLPHLPHTVEMPCEDCGDIMHLQCDLAPLDGQPCETQFDFADLICAACQMHEFFEAMQTLATDLELDARQIISAIPDLLSVAKLAADLDQHLPTTPEGQQRWTSAVIQCAVAARAAVRKAAASPAALDAATSYIRKMDGGR